MNFRGNTYISEKEYKFVSKHLHSSRTPTFYGLPKIQKLFEKYPPLRPVVSGFNWISASLSEYVGSFLKYQAKICYSCIRDTSGFLLKLKSLSAMSSTSILATMDINNLCTNIDHKESADACYKKLETCKNKTVSSNTLKNCILLILKCNIFRFCNTFHIQKKGTAMGSPMAANYADLFMDMFETSFLNDFHKKDGKKLLIWLHFIDDIFFIWTDAFSILPEIQWNKEYEISHNIWNVTIYQNHQFLTRLHHP